MTRSKGLRPRLTQSCEGHAPVRRDNSREAYAIKPGYLVVTCWCEERLFYVPASWIAEGRTASCGPYCVEGAI